MKPSISIGSTKRLGHLPLVMGVYRNIGIGDIIDHALGQDQRSDVSTGECVATILSGVYVGAHSLWRLSERMVPYDMCTIMQDRTYDLEKFNEERLAKALDDLYEFGLDKLMTDVALRAITAYSLNTDILRFDTTSFIVWGAYEREDPWSMSDGIDPPPKITYGHSKAHRGDLKQFMFGDLVNGVDGVPLMGSALDGNMSDSHAAAHFFGQVRKLVAHPREVTCVADSKGWCGRVVDVMQHEKLRLISRMPRTRSNHDVLMAKPWKPDETVIVKRRPGKPEERYEIMGFDIDESFVIEESLPDGTIQKRTLTTPARAIRVYSTALLRTKLKSIDRLRKREQRQAQKAIRGWQDVAYACASDARRAADRHVSQAEFATLLLAADVVQHSGSAKRGPGRPRRKPEPELVAGSHWRVVYRTTAVDEAQVAQRLHDQASFILVRMRNPGWVISDADVLACYRGQYRIEHGFSWLKSGAELNPIFLQTPHRIASLCFIYCLGLMLWTIIQRTVRGNLHRLNTGLPYHRNKPSPNITTRFLFELFHEVASVSFVIDGKGSGMQLANFTDINRLACTAAGISEAAYNPLSPL